MSALPVFAINLWLAGVPVLLITAAVLALCRNAPARLRYLIALAGFVGVIVIPMALTREAAPLMVNATELQTAHGGSSGFALAAMTLWMAGSFLLILRDVLAYQRLHREQRMWWPAEIPTERSRFSIVLSNEGAPRTHGLFRPVIVLPAQLTRAGRDIVRLVVAHEESHARWRDPMVHAIIRLARSLFWIALPLWIAERLVIREREAAADEAALASEPDTSRSRYAEALVEFCRITPRRSGLSIQLGAAADLEYRVRRILRASSGAGSFLIALGLFAGGFLLLAFTPLLELPAEVVVEVEDVRAVQKLEAERSTSEVQAAVRTQIEKAIEKKVQATTALATGSARVDVPAVAAVAEGTSDASASESPGSKVEPSPLTPLPPGEGKDEAVKPVPPVSAPELDDEVIVIRDVHRHRHVARGERDRREGDITVDSGRSKHPVALFHRGVTAPVKRFVRRLRGDG